MEDDARSRAQSSPESVPHATPRWVKVFGTIVTVIILLFIVLRFSVFANH